MFGVLVEDVYVDIVDSDIGLYDMGFFVLCGMYWMGNVIICVVIEVCW